MNVYGMFPLEPNTITACWEKFRWAWSFLRILLVHITDEFSKFMHVISAIRKIPFKMQSSYRISCKEEPLVNELKLDDLRKIIFFSYECILKKKKKRNLATLSKT